MERSKYTLDQTLGLQLAVFDLKTVSSIASECKKKKWEQEKKILNDCEY